jgi:1-pyrroline-4-hydroxy-2-carboxylate deaminase
MPPAITLDWTGVLPAITTPFRDDLSVDHAFLGDHAEQLVDAGCRAIVALGSLGEGATLSVEEKEAVLRTCVEAVGARVPVVAAVSALGTDEAVRVARMAAQAGCAGLMVLPPYVYASDWHEMRAHVDAVLRATDRPCMLYNNPIAYGTDFRPEQVADLAAAHPTLTAVKESSGDVRRVTALKALLGDRLALCVGLDDAVVEGVRAGATGWVAGLVNALPEESVALYEGARRGDDVSALYAWFLPLLRLDTVVKFVQLIKLVQAEVGMGSERVRPPRLVLEGAEREAALAVIRKALAARPGV